MREIAEEVVLDEKTRLSASQFLLCISVHACRPAEIYLQAQRASVVGFIWPQS